MDHSRRSLGYGCASDERSHEAINCVLGDFPASDVFDGFFRDELRRHSLRQSELTARVDIARGGASGVYGSGRQEGAMVVRGWRCGVGGAAYAKTRAKKKPALKEQAFAGSVSRASFFIPKVWSGCRV